MKPVFADTFFFFAILNRADPLHQRAAEYSRNARLLPLLPIGSLRKSPTG
jgi:hypothetical protein